ncbi:MAG TPA: polysaccharide biosynthesis tyrosine autokinase [Anaerolineaceae bacterium]|nr:polysaccharide biosynthesis tyrosine autokinase [Anaerolineaceae bacterium]
MEIKRYLVFLRRWGWLFILGIVLGAVVGILAGLYTTPIYSATTKIMVLQPQDQSPDLNASIYNQDVSQAITELLTTRPVIDGASQALGYPVSPDRVRVQRGLNEQLIQLTVEDSNPQHAANIANTMVKVFIQQNEAIQASRYSSMEEGLQTQLQQVEGQINALRSQLTQQSNQSLDNQIQSVSKTISDLQAQIQQFQEQIISSGYHGQATRTYDLNGRVVLLTPTPNVQQQTDLTAKQTRLQELQSLLAMYQRIYVDLSYPGGNSAIGGTRNADQVQAALALYQQIYTNLLSNYENVRLARLKSTPNVIQAEEAKTPSTPIHPRPIVNVSLGALLGLLLAGAIGLTIEYLDDTFRTPEEVSRVLQLPVLGFIGQLDGVNRDSNKRYQPYVLVQPRSPNTEAFRSLRTNLEFAEINKPLKTLLVTSPGVAEGKTTLAVNLGVIMAQSNRKVVLVDADLRRPSMHTYLGIPNQDGLTDMLRRRAPLTGVAQSYQNGHLSVVTSGKLPPNPVEILGSEQMRQSLTEMERAADIVVVDGPPFLLADALVLSVVVDAVLIVVRLNHTQVKATLAMLGQLERTNARVLGVVLNQVSHKENNYYYKGLSKYTSFSYEVEDAVSEEKRNRNP